MPPPLDADRWRRISALLDRVLDLPEAERAAAVDRLCDGDEALRAEVTALLRAEQESKSLLSTPAAYQAAALGLGAPHDNGHTLPGTGVAPDADPREGSIVGPYRLRRKIGEGGMGAVYLADRADGQFDQQVALKLLPPGVHDESWRRRFVVERQILARLQHPRIARLLDGGVTADGLPFFAMEFVDGEPITSYCRRMALPVRARLQLFLQVCDAVEYAHRSLVVHRDLKPSNVFVDAAGRVRLLDFGVAKWLGEDGDAGLTAASPHAGAFTPTYAAPEQLLGEPVTTATDVYALGVMLCELLTGALPYDVADTSRRRIERAILDGQPLRPSARVGPAVGPGTVSIDDWRAQLRGDLDLIVLKALRKEPDARYPSVTALAEDVQRHLADYPVSVRADAWSYRARKFVARHRVAAVASALAGLSIVAGVAGTAWQAQRARAEADRARAVQEFLVSLFRATEPGAGAQSRTVRDLLDQGEVRIEEELAGQPALQVELWRTVADVQRQLGDYERAERLLERAVARAQEASPSDVLLRARLRLQLAIVLNERYRLDDAARLAADVLPVLERELPGDHEDLGHAYDLLGSLRYQQGDYAEAERLRLLARSVFTRGAGPRSRQVADIDNNLAVFYSERGRHEEAVAAGRRAVDVRRALFGGEHPDTLLARYNLANALYARGRWDEAAREFEAILPAQEAALGASHPHVALTRRQIARLFTGQGRYDEASRMLQEVAALTEATYGHGSVPAGYVVVQQSRLAQLRGRFDEAVALGRRVVEDFERGLGPDHVDTAWARMSLADRLIDAGTLDEAGRLLGQARQTFERSGTSDPYLAQTLDLQGAIASRQGRAGQARAAFEQALRLLGDDATKALDGAAARWHLAVVLEGVDQLDRRARLFQDAILALRQAYPPQHTMVTEAVVAYGAFVAGLGRFGDAETLLREAYDVRRRTLGEDNILTAEAAAALARCLASAHRVEESRRLAAMAAPVLGRATGRRPWWEVVTQAAPAGNDFTTGASSSGVAVRR